MSSVPRVCSACGAASAWDARFCQQCGRRLDEDGATPRYYGLLSPGPAFVLGCLLLAAAAVALIAGSPIAALVLLAIAVVAFVFFYDAARRYPEHPVSSTVLSAAHRLRGWTRFTLASLAAWARAARDLLRLRRESRSLRRERDPILRSLGDAVYREDEPLVQTLRERIRELDGELARREEDRAKTLATARRQVDEERDAATSTQQLAVDDITAAGGVGSAATRAEGGAMHARVISFSGAATEKRENALETIRDRVLPMLRSYDGFAGYVALFDESNERARAIIFWDSEEAAVSAEETLVERREQMASSVGLKVESADLYEALVVELEGARV